MDTTQNTQPQEQETEAPVGVTASMNAIELASVINRYAADIDKTKNDLKDKNSMFKDAFENDAEYHELNAKVKDLNKKKNGAKQRILHQPSMEVLTAQINDLKSELKDAQDMLSGYLEQYQKVSGTNIIETEDGKIREIVPVFKLINRRV